MFNLFAIRRVSATRSDAAIRSVSATHSISATRILRRLGLICVLAAIASVGAPSAQAQTTGQIGGTVRDQQGALVPGATVTLVNVASKARRTTTSNGQGDFSISFVQPSTYDLLVTAKGFESYKVTGIEVHPGDSKNVTTIALKVGTVSQEVDVSATTAGVSTDSPEKSSLITAEDIARLSTVGRDASELIKTLPGFAVWEGGGLSNGNPANNSQTMGFTSSSIASYSANGGTPQGGGTNVISDGGSVIDPGDMGASIANINMDMVQEVKVQTSNFGADSAKGPVVINAVGKSGGSSFHGSAYLFARNGALNANDWYNNYEKIPGPNSSYYFPGFNVGGPVLIPGTNFNHARKLTFFAGFEVYAQNVYSNTLSSFVPTARMLSGDLTPASLASALNVSTTTLTTDCPTFYQSSQIAGNTLGNSGGICYSPGFVDNAYTLQDQKVVAGQVLGSGNGLIPVDPHANIYAKFWPAPNRTPQAGNGLASDGYNYVKAVTATNNGYQAHGRVDQNFTDSTKLYGTYNFEKVNTEVPIDNTYYYGSDGIPYPTPLYTHTYSNSLSLNFTHVFSPSLSNEAVAAGVDYNSPDQFGNRASVQDAATGWTGGRYYNNGALQLPGIVDYEEGVPDFAMGYIPSNNAFLRKISFNAGDNVTWQYRAHALKFGVYGEVTGNNQVPYNYTQGQNTFNHYNSGCIPDDQNTADPTNLHNNVANLLQGCTGFNQASSSLNSNMRFKTLDFYATDEWKATRRLTITAGIRFEHLGPWYDVHGVGLAVWTPPTQHVVYGGVTQDPHTFPGISWHQTNSSVPISGSPSTTLFYSPRAGLAYDLYGNGKTTFRGGWGAYRFHDNYNDAAGPLSTAEGIQNYTTPSNISCDYAQISNTTGGGNAAPNPATKNTCVSSSVAVAPFTVYALNPKDTAQPVTYNYNFTVDQVIPHGSNVEISYVGNRSQHTFTEGNLNNQNYIPLGGLFQPDPLTGQVAYPGTTAQIVQDYRPYPNYTQVYVPNHIGYGNYNALQVSWNRQRGAFIYGVNYTWAKALGVRGDYRTGAVGDPSNLRNNYGYLGFNRSSAINFTYSWQVGKLYRGNRFVAAVVNQWEFSGITNLQSGPDLAVLNGTSNTNFNLSGGGSYTPTGSTTSTTISLNNSTLLGTPDINLQPVVTCNPKAGLTSSAYGRQYLNGNCFALPKLGSNGAFELPDLHGPAFFNSDLTVRRTFKLKDKQALVFSLAGFNFLNHPLPSFSGGNLANLNLGFGDPTGFVATTPQQAFAGAVQTTPNFGYTPYKQGFRIVELGARYNF